MLGKALVQKTVNKPRKRHKKRAATSPLFDSGGHDSQTGQTGFTINNTWDSDHCNNMSMDNQSVFNSTPNVHMNTQNHSPNLVNFSQNAFNTPQQPPPQYQNYFPGAQQTPTHNTPPWANELMEDVRQIKYTTPKIENIEKAVTKIKIKASELETKIITMEIRMNEVESSCSFMNAENEKQKKEIKSSKEDIKQMQKECRKLQESAKSFEKQKETMNDKITDLESRSMRENLMFYGIKEIDRNENCEDLVKMLIAEKLEYA